MAKGKLIVIEGLDGSGKNTQSGILTDSLNQMGIEAKELSFPCYGQPSCALVEMYLQGEFGDKPNSVGPYAASTFYAVDRYASFKKDWGEFYNNGGVVVANRYVTSNLVHQMTKLDPSEWKSFVSWLSDLEYDKFGIPKPDLVVFLDMPVEVSQKLMLGRYHGDEQKKDIHEKDVAYLLDCHKAAAFAIEAEGWFRVACSDGEAPLSIEEISQKVLTLIQEELL